MSAQPAIGPAAKFQSAAKGVGNGQNLAVGLQDAVVPAIAQGVPGEPAFVVELLNTVVTGAVVVPGAIEVVDSYIRWYNEKRIKISLGSLSPIEYRASLGLTA